MAVQDAPQGRAGHAHPQPDRARRLRADPRAWRRLGYPFDSLTPSYATALGASGDRPAALAELMGIIVNRGMRLPVERVGALQFARGTPYETRLRVPAGTARARAAGRSGRHGAPLR